MMKKIIVGTLLLIAGTAISQTTQQKMAAAKSKSQEAATQTPVKPKTQSLDAANPNYRKEQKKYTGPDRDFSSTQTKKGGQKAPAKKKL